MNLEVHDLPRPVTPHPARLTPYASRLTRLTLILLPSALIFSLACARTSLFPPAATPTATLPPTLTPSLTPPPSPTPSPTPVPPARIEAADEAMFAGDWSRALAEYQAVLEQTDASGPSGPLGQTNASAPLRPAAQLGLGKARLNGGDAPGAINELAAFLQQHPDSPQAADANFLLGEAYRATGAWVQAVEAYRAYQQLRPGTIDSYVEERIGQSASFNQDYRTAEQAYLAAIAAPRADAGETLDLRERLAEVYLALGETEEALAQYEAIYQSTNQNWRKARMDSLAGQLLYNSGQTDQAYAKFLDAVNNYPEAQGSFQGLLTLVNDGVPVDDLQRGLTNYYAENYEPALAAFDRYIAANPQSGAAALYHKGLAHAALKQDAAAIAAFREIVNNYPNDAYWTKAYFQIAFIQPYPQDVQTFQNFVAAAPASPEAPDALYRAARLCERNGDFKTANLLWTRIALEYPASAPAADAAMQAGIVLYRAGDFGSAGQRFELASTLGGDTEQHARAWLWIGKVKEKLGDAEGARKSWAQAASLDPHGYYSLRAANLLKGEKSLFTPPPAGSYALSYGAAAEQAETEAWLRANFPLLKTLSPLSDLQPGIWKEARFVRGAELWRLGLLREAHAEFDSLRLDMQGDPLAMWQLALYFNRLGAYDLSIRSARTVVDLAGYTDSLLAPRFILRLRYPAPFADLVEAAAAQYDQHPFLMLAKMRIESFFWKYAFSSAEARGLNQIIPPTADDIARRLGLQNFTYDDLYRPAVSIPMGAFYLSFVGKTVEDDPAAILAGYYAGPGNAQIWQDLARGDPDLFVEVIRLPDAKYYVQTAYEYFEEYKELYEVD